MQRALTLCGVTTWMKLRLIDAELDASVDLTTYVYNHCNICNISIYFCNISLKHLKHLKQTFATHAFKHNICLLLSRNGGLSTRSSMLRTSAEVAGVNLVGGTDLDKTLR
jgi:hypothetical protein